jgi:hypothetical protein
VMAAAACTQGSPSTCGAGMHQHAGAVGGHLGTGDTAAEGQLCKERAVTSHTSRLPRDRAGSQAPPDPGRHEKPPMPVGQVCRCLA